MSQLDILVDEIVSRSEPVGAAHGHKKKHDSDLQEKQRKVVAAGVLVVRDRGIDWASSNLDACQSAVTDLLSSGGWITTLLGFLGFASPWVGIIAELIPVLVKWFSDRNAAGVAMWGPGMTDECERALGVK